jgi:hypothetical protein
MHGTIVIAVTNLVAPTVGCSQCTGRKPRLQRQDPVRPIQDSQEAPIAHRCCAVAFLFQVAAARAAQDAGKLHGARGQDAFCRPHGERANMDICDDFPHEGLVLHKVLSTGKSDGNSKSGHGNRHPEALGNDHDEKNIDC